MRGSGERLGERLGGGGREKLSLSPLSLLGGLPSSGSPPLRLKRPLRRPTASSFSQVTPDVGIPPQVWLVISGIPLCPLLSLSNSVS